MSSRVTRSTARRAADSAEPNPPSDPISHSLSPPKSRKRKAPPNLDPGPDSVPGSGNNNSASGRAAKRNRISNSATQAPPASKSYKKTSNPPPSMAKPGYASLSPECGGQLTLSRPSTGDKDNEKLSLNAPETSKRKGSKGKKSGHGMFSGKIA